MKNEIKKQADVEEFIEQKALVKDHSESDCPERNLVIITAAPRSSSDYCDHTAKIRDYPGHFLNPLVVADTVYYGKGDGGGVLVFVHGVKLLNTAQRRKGTKGSTIVPLCLLISIFPPEQQYSDKEIDQ